MARVTSKITWDIETGEVLEHLFTDGYEGPWALAGKESDEEKYAKRARAEQEKLRAEAMRLAQEDAARRKELQGQLDPFRLGLLSTEPGKLSPRAEAEYGSDLEKIASAYENMRRVGLKSLGVRGFGRAPSGMGASITNTTNEAKGQAETDAYRAALDNTLKEGLAGADITTGLMGLYDPNRSMATASGINSPLIGPGRQPADIGGAVAGGASAFKDLYGLFNKKPAGIIVNYGG